MRPELDILEQIDLYLEGKLSGQELLDFQLKIENDIHLKNQIESVRNCNNLLLDMKLVELKSQMQKDLNEVPSQNPLLKKVLLGLLPFIVLTFYVFLAKENETKITSKSSVSKEELILNNEELTIKSTPGIVKNKNYSTNSNVDKVAQSKIENVDLSNAKISNLNEVVSHFQNEIVVDNKESVSTVENINVENPCQSIKIEADIHVQHSCKENPSGQIIFNNVKGGHGPYNFKISKIGGFDIETSFMNLEQGVYTPQIQDVKGCLQEFENVIINSFNCDKKENDFAFNPLYNEVFKFPIESGYIKIFAKDGRVIFEGNIAEHKEWNGQTKEGSVVNTGTYLYLIETTTGGQLKGYVTVY